LWTSVLPSNTTRPALQLVLGAIGGGIGGFDDSVQSGERGWALAGDTLLGAATGATTNMGIGDHLGIGAGFGSGVADSMGGDLINKHKVTGGDVGWAILDGSLNGAENSIETGMSNAHPSKDATVGNSWGVGISGAQGLLCGGMDGQQNWNC
jgi:hypothetical protein